MDSIAVPIMEGESVGAYVRRNDAFERLLLGKVSIPGKARPVGFQYPRYLAAFANELSAVFTSVDQIIEGHTPFPAYRPFLSPLQLEDAERSLREGRSGRSSPGSGFTAISGNSSRRWLPAWCPDCFEEDRCKNGFGHFHREHQIYGSDFCGAHERRLVTFCGKCPFSSRASRRPCLPGSCCPCGVAPKEKDSYPDFAVPREFSLIAARIIYDLLENGQDLWCKYDRASFASAYRYRAYQLGIIDSEYKVNDLMLNERIVKRIGEQTHDAIAECFRLSKGWFRKRLDGGVTGARLIANIAIIVVLFDGKDDLLKVLNLPFEKRDIPLRDRTIKQAELQQPRRFLECKAKKRQLLLNLMADDPNVRRSDLPHALYLWLLHWDKEWLAETLPNYRGQKKQATPQERFMKLSKDMNASIFVLDRYIAEKGKKDGRPEKMSRGMLLRGSGLRPVDLLKRDFFMTRACVEHYEESPYKYKSRYVLWIFSHPEVVKKRMSLTAYAIEQTAFNVGEIHEILLKHRDLMRDQWIGA